MISTDGSGSSIVIISSMPMISSTTQRGCLRPAQQTANTETKHFRLYVWPPNQKEQSSLLRFVSRLSATQRDRHQRFCLRLAQCPTPAWNHYADAASGVCSDLRCTNNVPAYKGYLAQAFAGQSGFFTFAGGTVYGSCRAPTRLATAPISPIRLLPCYKQRGQ